MSFVCVLILGIVVASEEEYGEFLVTRTVDIEISHFEHYEKINKSSVKTIIKCSSIITL